MPKPAARPERMNAQLKRHLREKARRERVLRQKPPGVKEKLVAGCFSVGIVGAVVFVVALIWACVTAE
jgi:hypothetical protein